MDPVANLTEQRELAARLTRAGDGDEGARETAIDDAVRLAELVTALDEWRAKGGADPYAAAPEGDPLQYAVHLEGALIDKGMPDRYNWADDETAAGLVTAFGTIPWNDEGEAVYGDPSAAIKVAAGLKSADPETLVTIVIWHDN